jgi:hypothetical protein
MAEDSRSVTDIPAAKKGKGKDKGPCQKHEPYDMTYADKGFRFDGETILARYVCRGCGNVFSIPAIR